MSEIEKSPLPETFDRYLSDIDASGYKSQVQHHFGECKGLVGHEPRGMFLNSVAHEEQTEFEDLFFFYDGLCVRIPDFVDAKGQESFELIPLKKARRTSFTKKNFSFESAPRESESAGPPQLTVTIELENGYSLEFKAARRNCIQLLPGLLKQFPISLNLCWMTESPTTITLNWPQNELSTPWTTAASSFNERGLWGNFYANSEGPSSPQPVTIMYKEGFYAFLPWREAGTCLTGDGCMTEEWYWTPTTPFSPGTYYFQAVYQGRCFVYQSSASGVGELILT
jgi:hypothetical protein